jgi:PKD repeat protein
MFHRPSGSRGAILAGVRCAGRRFAPGLLGVAVVLALASSAFAANSPPKLTPIQGVFDPNAFATTYSATAADPDGDKLNESWSLAPPAKDPACKKFSQLSPTKAIWHHGDKDSCNHAVQGPRGHLGTVRWVVSDGTWICTETYDGTISGAGGGAVCLKSPPPPAYKCSGTQIKLFDNSNGGGVLNGGKPPGFNTNGKAYCVVSITTYHWNNGQGKAPGTIGLTGSSTVGPFAAKGSAGQGGAPNVNWTATAPAGKPAVIDGTYSCQDSDPASWSQNQQTGGKGFCIVYGTNAVKTSGSSAAGKKTTTTNSKGKTKKPATGKGKSKTTKPAAGKGKSGGKGKLSIKASPDNGKPPLTITFTLSSPKVVQWRIDYGDGQSKVAIGQPPATIAHTYKTAGDYRPRLTVISSQNATTSSSATTSVSVATAPLMSFTATPASGNPPLKVTFGLGTTVVAQSITSWSVDFGDGQHAGGSGKPPASVSHTYAAAGSYKATFAVKPGAYAVVATFAQVTVGGGTPPVLSLSASPTSGKHPLAVRFTLGSNIPGTIVSWQLQFGDGQRAGGSGKPPASVSHTYAKAGTYAAFLVVAQQQQYGGVQYVVPRGGLAISVG